jgi:CheY-like chemotaxis protein
VGRLCPNMSARRDRPPEEDTLSLSAPRTTASILHVLHVDDSVDDHLLLKAAGEMAGVPFSWEVAECADTAIFYLRTLLALGEKGSLRWPDLVLLDVSLPQGGGFKVLEFIRSNAELSSLKVVVLSGTTAPGVLEQAYELGANSVLVKPGAFRELVKLAASLHANWSVTREFSPEISPFADTIHLTAS